MTSAQSLVQAALNRLGARLGSGLVDTAANLALLAQDAPEKLRQELELFVEEVQQEAERLERGGAEQGAAAASAEPGAGFSASGAAAGDGDLQDQIDQLRAQVAGLSRLLDQRP